MRVSHGLKQLLVCDLDNTLYDWVGYFVPAFYSMVDEAVRITGCNREQLLDDLRDVHRKHHDAEHPYALLETRSIRSIFGRDNDVETREALEPAFKQYDSARESGLKLYPGVRQTLDALSGAGVALVAHTESRLHAVVGRLTRLNLTNYFRHIYCRERTLTRFPLSAFQQEIERDFPMQRVSELTYHQRKPDPRVLLEICEREGIAVRATAYVGDSMSRDVTLAKRADVFAVWAKYGVAHSEADYERLVRISHWTDEDIAREIALNLGGAGIAPDLILESTFAEILPALVA